VSRELETLKDQLKDARLFTQHLRSLLGVANDEQLLHAIGGLKGSEPFVDLVDVMTAAHDKDNAPPTMAVDAMSEIDDCIDMLNLNFEEEDGPEVMIQNVASLVAAAFRMAAVLQKDITPEKMTEIIEENRP